MEESRNRRLAHVHLFFRQANLKLRKSTIRLFGHEFLNSSQAVPKREKVLYPPNLSGLTLPVSALTLDESANSTQSHVVQLGNFHTGMAGFGSQQRHALAANRWNKAFPFMTGPLVPVGMLNLICAAAIIHNRFGLFVKCSGETPYN